MVRGRPGAAAALAVVAFAFVACLRRIGDLDYWTHLALGRAFVRAGTLVVGEPFVARTPQAAVPETTLRSLLEAATSANGWPFQLGVYAVESVGGHVAVSIAIAACGAAAAALLTLALRAQASPARAALAATFAAAAFHVARFRFSPRPEAPAAVLLAAVLVLALAWARRPRWRLVAAVGAVLAAWRLLHVTWSLGAALAAVAFAAGPWREFLRGQSRALRVAAVAAAALAAVPAARFGLFVLRELRGGLLAGVTEMRPTWEFPSVAWPFAALSAAGLALAWGGRERRAARLALWAAAVALGAIVVRNVAFAALALVPVAIDGLATAPARPWRLPARWAAAGAALAMAALLGLALRDRDYPFGAGVDWRQYPRAAAEYVREARLESPVFNFWDWGGYLAWAWSGSPRTFLDGRLFDRATMDEHDEVIGPAPAAALARRGFRTVLLQPLFRNSGRLVPAVPWFLSSPEWRLVHAEDGLVFARVPLPPGVAEVDRAGAWRAVLRFAAFLEWAAGTATR